MANQCVVCGGPVVHKDLRDSDYYVDLCERADALGMETLTEDQQVFVMGKVCSEECYYDLQ